MKTIITTVTVIFLVLTTNAQDTISILDFKSIDNTNWKGTLTYTDYQSGKLATVDATMQFKIDGDKIKTSVQYTYEPGKNYNGSVKIKKNGTYFGNEKVVSFSENDGTKVLITTYKGKDNNRKATMFMTRTLTNDTYSVSKEVVYTDTNKRLIRNTYNYTKIN